MDTIIRNGICIITPGMKQIDITNATTFGEDISKAMDRDCDFIIDLGNIGFMDSSGLGKLIESIRSAREKEKKLVFCNTREAVKVLFSMVNLSQIATLYDTLEEAEEKILQ